MRSIFFILPNVQQANEPELFVEVSEAAFFFVAKKC